VLATEIEGSNWKCSGADRDLLLAGTYGWIDAKYTGSMPPPCKQHLPRQLTIRRKCLFTDGGLCPAPGVGGDLRGAGYSWNDDVYGDTRHSLLFQEAYGPRCVMTMRERRWDVGTADNESERTD
jgi:hypothetical protein